MYAEAMSSIMPKNKALMCLLAIVLIN